MGARVVLVLIFLGFLFIAGVSFSADKTAMPSYCEALMTANSYSVYGQNVRNVYHNPRGEILVVSDAEFTGTGGLESVHFISFKIGKTVDSIIDGDTSDAQLMANRARNLFGNRALQEDLAFDLFANSLRDIVSNTLNLTEKPPVYAPIMGRRSRYYPDIDGHAVLMLEGFKLVRQVRDTQLEAIIRVFLRRH